VASPRQRTLCSRTFRGLSRTSHSAGGRSSGTRVLAGPSRSIRQLATAHASAGGRQRNGPCNLIPIVAGRGGVSNLNELAAFHRQCLKARPRMGNVKPGGRNGRQGVGRAQERVTWCRNTTVQSTKWLVDQRPVFGGLALGKGSQTGEAVSNRHFCPRCLCTRTILAHGLDDRPLRSANRGCSWQTVTPPPPAPPCEGGSYRSPARSRVLTTAATLSPWRFIPPALR